MCLNMKILLCCLRILLTKFITVNYFIKYVRFLKSGKMSEKDAQKMLIDLLEGFTELNKHGIIHRDLKL